MTYSKTILGISLAAVFAISLVAGQTAIADDDDLEYRQIEETKVTVTTNSDGEGFLKAVIETEDKIPKKGQKGAFGFGLITDETSAVLALTTHLCVADSLVQGDAKDKKCPNTVGLLDALTGVEGLDEQHDDAKFHAHMLVLTGDTTGCTDPDTFAQVDVGATLAYNAARESSPGALDIISPDWEVKVRGDKITVKDVPLSALPDSGVEAIVSYGISGEANEAGTVTNVCLTNPPAEDD